MYKKIVVVHKTSRLTRFQRQGFLERPYIEQNYVAKLKETHDHHHAVIDTFVDSAKRMGKEVSVVSEDDLHLEDEQRLMENTDLVFSMGGDHTFLRT